MKRKTTRRMSKLSRRIRQARKHGDLTQVRRLQAGMRQAFEQSMGLPV